MLALTQMTKCPAPFDKMRETFFLSSPVSYTFSRGIIQTGHEIEGGTLPEGHDLNAAP